MTYLWMRVKRAYWVVTSHVLEKVFLWSEWTKWVP